MLLLKRDSADACPPARPPARPPSSTVHDSPFDNADLASVFNKCLHILACLAINDGLNTRFVIPSILTKCAILCQLGFASLGFLYRYSVVPFPYNWQPCLQNDRKIGFDALLGVKVCSTTNRAVCVFVLHFFAGKKRLCQSAWPFTVSFLHFNAKCTCFVTYTCTKRLDPLQSGSADVPSGVVYWWHLLSVLVTTADVAPFAYQLITNSRILTYSAVMRRLTTAIRSEKYVVRRFRRCANVRVYLHKPRLYSLLHTYAIWYSLLLLGYKPVQHVTVRNTVGNCNTMIGSIIL